MRTKVNQINKDILKISIISLSVMLLLSQNAYASNLTFEENLDTALDLEQIYGQVISSMYAINLGDYELAKMHLLQSADNDQNMIHATQEFECIKEIRSNLKIVSQTNIEEIFDDTVKHIKSCKKELVKQTLYENKDFTNSIVYVLFEQSLNEYISSQNTTGIDSTLQFQTSLGLIVRAHIILKGDNYSDLEFGDEFKELFTAYNAKLSPKEIHSIENTILSKIHYTPMSEEVIPIENTPDVPKMHLMSKKLSSEKFVIVFTGEGFEKNTELEIECTSPFDGQTNSIHVRTTEDGDFYIPLLVTSKLTDKPFEFSLVSKDVTLYQVLSIDT